MLVEKYRPKEFHDVIGLDDKIVAVVEKGDIPHLLFHSLAPGTGKTTTALIIKHKLGCDTLMLNASDERGIDTVREKVKAFASTASTNGKYKLVFLDEADSLTPVAQDSLRNMMETYYSNCRFIITCNYINKISGPLLSRCQKFKFSLPNKAEIKDRLAHIIITEDIKIEDEAIDELICKHYPDIRSCINKIDALNIGKTITVADINRDLLIIEDLFINLKTKPISYIRQWLMDNNVDYKTLMIEMSNYIWKNLKTIQNATQLLLELADSNYKINLVVDQDIEFARLLIKCKLLLLKEK